jgi:dienelactone hydrolase
MKQTLLIVALLAGVTACGSPSNVEAKPDKAQQRIATVDTPCLDAAARTSSMVTWPGSASELGAGYQAGTGDTAVVLLHQIDNSLCNFKEFADYLATQGMRALAVDVTGPSRLDDTVGAVAYLRTQGAKRVFIVGGSLGAGLGIVAAAKATPPVDGVVAMSAPAGYKDVDARTAVKSLTMPILFAAERDSGGFTEAAQEMYASCPATAKNIFLIGTADHGIGLLDNGMKRVIREFLNNPAAAATLSI